MIMNHIDDALRYSMSFSYIKYVTYYGNDRKFMNNFFSKNSILTDLEICLN